MASFLVLAACGQEESKSEDKKETKSSDKESKKDDKKKESDKEKDKTDDKSKEDVAKQDETTEQPVQSQEQVNNQEQQPVQSQVQAPVQQEPTAQEKAEANAKVAKENGYTGLPNGDAMFDMPGSADGYYSNDQLDPDTGLPKDDAVPHKNGEGPMAESDWVKGQDEWMNASESERTEIRKADAEKYGYEYDPSDYE